MNNLYSWHDERMVDWEMREIRREIGQACLLRGTGISDTNWLVRAVDALRNLLITRGKGPQDRRSLGQRSYQSCSDQVAQ
jgi:hypothetical protein